MQQELKTKAHGIIIINAFTSRCIIIVRRWPADRRQTLTPKPTVPLPTYSNNSPPLHPLAQPLVQPLIHPQQPPPPPPPPLPHPTFAAPWQTTRTPCNAANSAAAVRRIHPPPAPQTGRPPHPSNSGVSPPPPHHTTPPPSPLMSCTVARTPRRRT